MRIIVNGEFFSITFRAHAIKREVFYANCRFLLQKQKFSDGWSALIVTKRGLRSIF